MELRRVAGALIALALLTSCSGGEQVEEPTPEPSPTAYEIHPVVGERIGGVEHVGSEPLLGHGEAQPVDNAVVEQLIQAVESFLDNHLDDLQNGGPGILQSVAAPDLALDDPDAVAAVTTDLASPEAPVASARYHITVYTSGPLEWIHARIEVTHPDDSVASTSMIFTAAEDGQIRLILAGPEAGEAGGEA